ncbi:MAG TPA: nuclear transport factor 2 family protein [Acidobacteriaceae bacterium]|jgi:hypothetical protein
MVWDALVKGDVDTAVAYFAEQFRFIDHALDLDFRDKTKLAGFFQKERELYPDGRRTPEGVFIGNDWVVSKWTLRTTVTQPWFGGASRKVQVALPGISIVELAQGRIISWEDYYDSSRSRSSALADHFTDWIEL